MYAAAVHYSSYIHSTYSSRALTHQTHKPETINQPPHALPVQTPRLDANHTKRLLGTTYRVYIADLVSKECEESTSNKKEVVFSSLLLFSTTNLHPQMDGYSKYIYIYMYILLVTARDIKLTIIPLVASVQD